MSALTERLTRLHATPPPGVVVLTPDTPERIAIRCAQLETAVATAPPVCHDGHLLTEDNVYWDGGRRRCRLCRLAYYARRARGGGT